MPDKERSAFSIPIFRAMWIAALGSNFGIMILSVGAAWLMTSLTTSALLVALVQSSTSLPIMLLALAAGALADNFDRRTVMLTAQCVMLAISIIFAACAWFQLLTPWSLLGLTFLIGCGTALYVPAWQASIGDMVPRELLSPAIAINSIGFNVARSLGPALGGVIVAAVGPVGAFLANAASYPGLILVLARWKPHPEPRLLPRESLGHAMASGLRYVIRSPYQSHVLIRSFAFSLSAVALPALMPLVGRNLMQGSPLIYGGLLTAFGCGAVLGAPLSARLRRVYTAERIVRSAACTMAIAMAITAASTSLPLTALALMLAGGSWVTTLSTFNVTIQLASPRWVLARALALFQMSSFAGMAAGGWIFGMGAEKFGISTALWLASGVQLLGLLIAPFYPVHQVNELDLNPVDGWSEPETAFPIEPRSGPIVISVEYRISPPDISEFLAAMSERRRIRQRDGAHNWSLLRDLSDREAWIERYQVPTWLDYVRHVRRRTQADMHNFDRIIALHRGSDPPKISRSIERQTGSLPEIRRADLEQRITVPLQPMGST